MVGSGANLDILRILCHNSASFESRTGRFSVTCVSRSLSSDAVNLHLFAPSLATEIPLQPLDRNKLRRKNGKAALENQARAMARGER